MKHPFVKIHIVDLKTGMYLQKKQPQEPYRRAYLPSEEEAKENDPTLVIHEREEL